MVIMRNISGTMARQTSATNYGTVTQRRGASTQGTVVYQKTRSSGTTVILAIVMTVVAVIVPVTARLGVTEVQQTIPLEERPFPYSVETVERCMIEEHIQRNREECRLVLRQLEKCDLVDETARPACFALRNAAVKVQELCVSRPFDHPILCTEVNLFTEEISKRCEVPQFNQVHRRTCEDNRLHAVVLEERMCDRVDYYSMNPKKCETLKFVLEDQMRMCEGIDFQMEHPEICRWQRELMSHRMVRCSHTGVWEEKRQTCWDTYYLTARKEALCRRDFHGRENIRECEAARVFFHLMEQVRCISDNLFHDRNYETCNNVLALTRRYNTMCRSGDEFSRRFEEACELQRMREQMILSTPRLRTIFKTYPREFYGHEIEMIRGEQNHRFSYEIPREFTPREMTRESIPRESFRIAREIGEDMPRYSFPKEFSPLGYRHFTETSAGYPRDEPTFGYYIPREDRIRRGSFTEEPSLRQPPFVRRHTEDLVGRDYPYSLNFMTQQTQTTGNTEAYRTTMPQTYTTTDNQTRGDVYRTTMPQTYTTTDNQTTGQVYRTTMPYKTTRDEYGNTMRTSQSGRFF